jgi:hypothetical protein
VQVREPERDGTVDLYDIALMNDLIAVEAENEAREAIKK